MSDTWATTDPPMLEPHLPTEEERIALCEWLRANGIDPQSVPIGSSFLYEGATRTWTFEEVLLDRYGGLIVVGDEVMSRYVSVAEATPFPLGG